MATCGKHKSVHAHLCGVHVRVCVCTCTCPWSHTFLCVWLYVFREGWRSNTALNDSQGLISEDCIPHHISGMFLTLSRKGDVLLLEKEMPWSLLFATFSYCIKMFTKFFHISWGKTYLQKFDVTFLYPSRNSQFLVSVSLLNKLKSQALVVGWCSRAQALRSCMDAALLILSQKLAQIIPFSTPFQFWLHQRENFHFHSTL